MAPIDPWRNSTPIFGALAFCTTNIEDFRTHLTSMSSTISSTYSSQKRSLRWTSSKRKIMEVIEVDQLEDINNERLSWAMPHSGLRVENKKKKMKNKKIPPPKNLVLPPLPHTYSGRMCRFAPFLKLSPEIALYTLSTALQTHWENLSAFILPIMAKLHKKACWIIFKRWKR